MSDESFFSRKLSALKNVGKGENSAGNAPGVSGPGPQVVTYNQLETQVKELTSQVDELKKSEAELKEKTQQLGLQKSLLEDLVDKLGDSEDSTTEAESMQAEIKRLIIENSEVKVDLQSTSKKLDTSETQRHDAEKRAEAFMKAVENANNELLNSDTDLKATKAKAEEAEEASVRANRLQAELDSTHLTVEALMSRVSKMDHEKEDLKARIAELEAGGSIEPTVEATESKSPVDADEDALVMQEDPGENEVAAPAPSLESVAEISKLKEDLSFTKQQVTGLKSELAGEKKRHDETKGSATASQAKLEEEIRTLQHELNNVMTTLSETKQTLKESTGEKDQKIAELQDQYNSAMSAQTLRDQGAREKIDEMESELDRLRESSETASDRIGNLTIAVEEGKTQLEKEEQKYEALRIGSQEALEAAKRQIDDLEESHLEINSEVEKLRGETVPNLECQISDLDDKLAAEQRTRQHLRQECDRLQETNEEIDSRLAEIEDEVALKQKKDATKIKELQRSVVSLETQLGETKAEAKRHKADADSLARQQLRRANSGGGEVVVAQGARHVDPNGSSSTAGAADDDDAVQLVKDNNNLIQRIASFQEQVWMLEQVKTEYEGEIQRLNDDIGKKSSIIQAHFAEAAQKANKSFFGPKASEINEQQQLMLEKTLAENMQLQEKLGQTSRELNNAMEVVREAELQGFVAVVEEGEETNLDYDGHDEDPF